MKDSSLFVVGSRGANALIQFLIVIYYASNFTASEFGQLSILMIVIGIAYGLIDFGVANTIITRRLTSTTLSGLQFINTLIGIFIGALLSAIGYFEIKLFGFDFDFYEALTYSLPLYTIYSFTVVPYARFHKALKLKLLAIVDFFPVASLLISVPALLYLDFGLSTLFISITFQVIFRFFILRYFYGPMIRLSLVKNIPFKILIRQYSSNVIVYITSKVDQLIVAGFMNSETLGIYSFLKQVLNYPISLMIAIYTQITFPYFSRFKNDIVKVKKLLFASSATLVSLMVLYFMFIIALPPEIMSELVPVWNFRGELAYLVMITGIVRVLVEVLSAMTIAVGLISKQLVVNFVLMCITFLSGMGIPFYGISNYLIALSVLGVSVSCFIYLSTFSRLSNEKNSTLHSI